MIKKKDTGSHHRIYTEDLFGPLVKGRSCGGCTVCCVETKVNTHELTKEPRVPCPHLEVKGCGIYDNRFKVCRSWHCLWRHVDAMPEEARPDKLGVMFGLAQDNESENLFKNCYIHALAFKGQETAQSPMAQALYEMFTQGDIPLWVSTHQSDMQLLHPETEVATAVLEPQSVKDRKILKEAKKWRQGTRQHHKSRWRHFLQVILPE